MKKSPTNLIDLGNLDPSVAAAIGLGERRASEASLPRDQRARLAKSRAKDEKRHRFNMDLDPALNEQLNHLASEYCCPASGLANLAIYLLLDAVALGDVDINQFLGPTKSMRYEHTVFLPTQNRDTPEARGTPIKK